MNRSALPVPTGPGDLTSSLVSGALGQSVAVTAVERVGEEFGFSGESYRVAYVGSDGRGSVVAKLWALRDPGDVRELHFYGELAADTPIRLPAFHHGDVDPAQGRAWLVLEDLNGFRQGDDLVQETPTSVFRLVETMAVVHAAWSDRVGGRTWLPRAPRFHRDAEYLASRRAEYLERFGPITEPTSRRMFDMIPTLTAMAGEFTSEAPETLLHLDLGLDNILFLLPDDQPVPIDWARCGRGPGVHDLASILFGIAPLELFAEVVDHYAAALHESNPSVDASAVRRQLNGGLIHAFVTRTLGVARWAAATPRGQSILGRWMDRTPLVVAAWRRFDPEVFERVGA